MDSLYAVFHRGNSAPFPTNIPNAFSKHKHTRKQLLVSSRSPAVPWCPVDENEAQTHHHEGDAQSSKTNSQYFWSGGQGFIISRNDADVEDSGENENEAGSWCGTNDAKDAQNIGSKYHQHIDEGQQNEGDADMT